VWTATFNARWPLARERASRTLAYILYSLNVWSAARLQGESVGRETGLRKCIRLLVERLDSPSHDELRHVLAL